MSAHSGELTINLKAVRDNYKIMDGMSAPNCETAVSIKGNAYGLGVSKLAPILSDVGANTFFVATLDEALELRKILDQAKIYVFHGFLESEKLAYTDKDLVPVLNSLEQIKQYQDYALSLNRRLNAVLHFDTGMNRLGIKENEAQKIYNNFAVLDGLDINLVMSHFASSDEEHSPMNREQLSKFLEIAKHFKGAKRSLSNSGGVLLSEDYHLELTRPGIALYGGNPVWGWNPVNKPVISLKVPVLQVHEAKKGEKAGYNATYCFYENTNVAIVSAGYADGILRSAENTVSLYWNGYELPIRGRVSMDTVICDLCHVPESEYPQFGDMVEVIGEHQNLDDFSNLARTISYEILTNLGTRYRRLYID